MDLASEHWHFIGIGGAGMSALASALLDLGATVTGSDLASSDVTAALEARGARIYMGHSAANLVGATRVVLTGAVPDDNPELVAAHNLSLPVVKRADLLGQLMDTRRGVAVAGTHGKTTTSAMVAWVLHKAGRAPTYMVGGTIRGLGPGGHWGAGTDLVAEADEYDRSFLYLHPQVAVITNIETDHLEYYGTPEAIYEAFHGFALNTRLGGLLLVCADDKRSVVLAAELARDHAPFRVELYGTEARAHWQALNAVPNSSGTSYTVRHDGRDIASVALQVPGRHNVLNSLAAFASCATLGVDNLQIARLLGEFQGTGRRFELKGEAAGVTVIDDYAHHPTEIEATLEAARQRYPGRRLIVLFQPHTYTRTRDFLQDFARSLSAADRAIVTEIYASREQETLGMSGHRIVDLMSSDKATFAPTLDRASELLLGELVEGDVLLTLGAGDVWKVGDEILAGLKRRTKASD